MSTYGRRKFLRFSPLVVAAGVAGAELLRPHATAAATTKSAYAQATPPAVAPARGVSVPPGWGQAAAPRLAAAAAGTGRATVALLGDSLCRGYFASNLDDAGWGGLVRTAFQSTWGDGGSGFKSAADSTTWMNGVTGLSSAAVQAHYRDAGNLLAVAGSWVSVTGNFLGPSGVALKTYQRGDSITGVVRGSTVKVVFLDGGPYAMGELSIVVDGGAPMAVRPSGRYGIAVAAIAGLVPGSHTVVVTASGASATTPVSIIGLAGENDRGCVVNQFSRYGQTTARIDNSDSLRSGTWNGGWQYPADLFVFALGANDAHASVSGDAWALNVRRWLEGVYSNTYGGGATGAVDGVLVLPHIGMFDGGARPYVFHEYVIRARGLAEAYGLMVIDLWSIGRNSWNYWRSHPDGSYWADAGAPGRPGGDSIHLSDVGHRFVADVVADTIIAHLP